MFRQVRGTVCLKNRVFKTLNAANDKKFVDCGRLFHTCIARWAKSDYGTVWHL